MICFFVGLILFLVLFIYRACCLASECSRMEEKIENMSILQEYEKNKKDIGAGKYSAIEDYLYIINSKENLKNYEEELNKIRYDLSDNWNEKISNLKNKYSIVDLSDVLYKKEEFKKFNKWFNKQLKPFSISKYGDGRYGVCLSQYNYDYDWLEEIKTPDNLFGDGHCYEQLFSDYLSLHNNELWEQLDFDSENGMFYVNCNNKKDAEEVSYILSKLYRDEEKMIKLIKETKSTYGYRFDYTF